MKPKELVAILALVAVFGISNIGETRPVHWFECQDCHRSGKSFYDLNDNLCLLCHEVNSVDWAMTDGTPIAADGRFATGDASDAMGTFALYNSISGNETSHMWAGPTDSKPEAGALPPTLKIDGRYGISRGKITCARCHDPHAWDTKPGALKADNTKDRFCKDCHRSWSTSDPNAFETHPMVIDYNAAVLADPTKLNLAYNSVTGRLDGNVGNGDVSLVYNAVSAKWMVSCSTCHGVHYADSDSATDDGMYQQTRFSADPRYTTGLNPGDGKLLRSDGPGRTNKSALCQSCHLYREHGDDGTKGTAEKVGCLVCHSGHSYNDGTPNYFILRKDMTTTRYGAVTGVAYTQEPGTYTSPMPHNDGATTSTGGICEKCHGDAEAIPKQAGFHKTTDRCLDCHYHNDPTFSFKPDLSAASCGDCHGFPPRINGRGDLNFGGYAYDPDTNWNYGADPNTKNEEQTAHLSHEGYNSTYLNYYVYDTCNPCHGADSGLNAIHNTNDANYASFRDVPFDGIAIIPAAPLPVYDVSGPDAWTCTDVYCHSNGGPRDPSHVRNYNAGAIRTPEWDQASGGGLNHLIGAADQNVRCSSCHGNSATEMSTKGNSSAHGKHLNAGIACDVCHADTAASATSLAAGATDVKSGGKHVNGSINVVLSTSAVNGGLAPADYDPVQGTCATYCHDFAGVDPLIDWQTDTTTCGSCHGVTAATLTGGSHARHLDSSKANVACDECHGAGASSGAHTGHVDGVVTKLATSASCDVCHGVETASGESWDVSPTWGLKTSVNCETCHTGAVLCEFPTASPTIIAPGKNLALSKGHNYNSTTVDYASGNTSAKKLCTDCHVTIDDTGADGHVDGLGNGDILQAGFSCEACHTTGGSRSAEAGVKVATHDNTNPGYSMKNPGIPNFSKLCVACHDPHGSGNWAMIWDNRTKQNANDPDFVDDGLYNSVFSGNIVFTSVGGTSTDQDNSYDESGDTVANVDNADDICATCHRITDHNRRDLTGGGHHENETCTTTCHTHNSTVGGFMASGGDSCDSCHDDPPRAGYESYGKYGTTFGAHDQHTWVTTIYNSEDTSDCGICHPGAASYDYGHANNVMDLDSGIASLGGGNYRCTDLNSGLGCHASSGTDGYWTDTTDYAGNGLNCTACHSNGTNDGVLANAAPTTGAHYNHVTVGKTCTACHNNGVAISDLTHINEPDVPGGPSTDGQILLDRSAADLGEGAVLRAGMSYDQVTNFTCSGGIDLGCHNSKTGPNWRTFTGISCTNCHDPAGSATADPKSGLHNVNQGGVQKHDSTLPTNGCTECHDSTKPSSHADGNWQADQAGNTESRFFGRSGLVYNDTAGPNQGSCFDNGASGAGSLDQLNGCHSDNGVWKRLWSTDADSNTIVSGNPRCNVCHGQFGNWRENTSHAGTYGGSGSTRGSTHNTLGGPENACEDCHSYTTINTNHRDGNNEIDLNDAGATNVLYNSTYQAMYCSECHDAADPATSGTFTFPRSTAFPTYDTTVAGDNDPKQQCNSCHGDGTGRYWPTAPNTDPNPRNHMGRHEIHMERLATEVYGESIAQLLTTTTQSSDIKQKNLCEYCHTAPAGFGGHHLEPLPAEVVIANLWDKAADAGASYLSNQHGEGGNDTCSNVNCHNNKTTADGSYGWYDSVTGTCELCHTVGGTDNIPVNIHPNSGLHNIVPTVSGKQHDAGLNATNGCAACHTGILAQIVGGSHIDGSAAADGGATPNTDRGLFGAYTDAAVGTCAGTGVDNTSTCHADGGTWNRRWSTTAAVNDGATECANCHGTWAAGWNFDEGTNTDHTNPSTGNNPGDASNNFGDYLGWAGGQHPDCQLCHGWGDPTYNTTWLGSSDVNYDGHGDGHITMNGPVGFGSGYNALSLGCTAACHAESLAMNVGSGITPNYGDYGGGSCGSCHDDGSIPPDSGAHAAHGANGDSDYSECIACHGDNGDGYTGLTPPHNNGAVNFAAGITYDDNGSLGTNAAALDDTCATTICHSPAGNPATWGTPTSVGCDACHYYEDPAVAGNNSTDPNGLSAAHESHFAKGKNTCTLCHFDYSLQTVAPRLHIDGGVTSISDKANALQSEATIRNDTGIAIASSSCSGTGIGLGCHNQKPTPAWSDTPAGIACIDCHTAGGSNSADPTSGLHVFNDLGATGTTRHDQTLLGGNCVNCHDGATPSETHQDTNLDLWTMAGFNYNAANVVSYNSTVDACFATCHDDGGQWGRLWAGAEDATPSGLPGQKVCSNCHGQYASIYNSAGLTGWRQGTVHYRSGIGYNENKGEGHTDPGDECEDCHAYDSVANHQNNKLTFSGNGTAFTLTMGTHSTDPGLYCLSSGCHEADTGGGETGGQAADGTASAVFYNSLAYGMADIEYVNGTSTPTMSCTGCHGNSGTGGYWPDGTVTTMPAANDQPGEHQVHVDAIGNELGGTLAAKNATCQYCHPGNTHGGADGALPADVSMTDTDGDGVADIETGSTFLYIIGATVDNGSGSGIYRRNEADGRCSTIDCHANAPYTPGWFGDTVVPGAVSDLAYNSAVLSAPGTVVLEWSAPGDDNGDDGTAYAVDVRYSGSPINSGNFDSASKAGGVPSADRMGKQQQMVVDGLTPEANYYFALKTSDERYNSASWSPISNVEGPVAARGDNVAPDFYGLDRAEAADTTGEIHLEWADASDHSHPVTYRAWWSTYSMATHLSNGGSLPTVDTWYDPGTPPTSPGTGPDKYLVETTTTGGTSLRLTGMSTTDLYSFLVRATDAASPPNTDDNETIKLAIGKVATEADKTDKVYHASGSLAPFDLVDTVGSQVAGSASTTTTTFTRTDYLAATNIYPHSFAVYVSSGNSANSATAEVGYDSGSGFTSFSTAATSDPLDFSPRTKRVVTFKFDGALRKVPANAGLAVKITFTSAPTSVNWGGTNKGDLSVTEQPYNTLPSQVTIQEPLKTDGEVLIDWTTPATDADGDTVHYDVYATCASGYNAVIAGDLPEATTQVNWDSLSEQVGISASDACTVYVASGDKTASGEGDGVTHSIASAAVTIDNTGGDTVPPGKVTTLHGETRPKQGSVYLTWTAVGNNDGNPGQRATVYDIRYSTGSLVGTYNSATALDGAPVPAFAGERQGYEVLGLDPETSYYFALKVGDGSNWSEMSNEVLVEAGPKCGICHSTPPDEGASAGNHAKHGYTMADCDQCHYDGTNSVVDYTLAHQDGDIVMGYGTAYNAVVTGDTVTYYVDGTTGSAMIYQDDSAGGFNKSPGTGGDGDHTDDGTCYNFAQAGVKCHGPATPQWDATKTLACSACHGDYDDTRNRTVDPYLRPYDDTGEEPKAAPPVDLQGAETGAVVGQHLKHLNFSFRFSKGDSCKLCHLDNEHGDGSVDIKLDPVGAGDSSHYNSADLGPNGGGTCYDTSDNGCHGTGATPEWSDSVDIGCNNCHGMAGKTYSEGGSYTSATTAIGHVYTTPGGTMAQCTACHPEGHPQGADGDPDAFMIPNNPVLGINYRSGGVHLLNSISLEGPFNTEAEICWGCHDQDDDGNLNGGGDVNEFGTNTQTATGDMVYDYGTLDSADWTTANWDSAVTAFGYKYGAIQSTHTANPAGASSVSYNSATSPPRYEESTDAVADIRCSWCHDVHDLNLVASDQTSGSPFLRGSWMGNPYKEDGAPQAGTVFDGGGNVYTQSGAGVPRSQASQSVMGGYWIDQNSGNPTSGWTISSSAGLCVLCHGSDADAFDQTKSESLWLSSNGHANSTFAGSGAGGANIFRNSTRNGNGTWNGGTWMGSINTPSSGWRGGSTKNYIGTIRTADYGDGVNPLINGKPTLGDGATGISGAFVWGVAVDDAAAAETGVHQFGCSKCHNPHASRLPKLMITNCLDVRHNTWVLDYDATPDNSPPAGGDPANSNWSNWNTTSISYGTTKLAYASSAQNCHRYVDVNLDGTPDEPGWNKVTPW